MKNEQIMATANNVSSSASGEILLFQLPPKYSNETRKGCGLLGKEIDANFQYLNGNDIVDFRVKTTENEDGSITNNLIIQLRNGYEFPVSIDEEFNPDSFSYDPVHGILTITRFNGEVIKLTGFLTEGRDIHVVNDGTIDGDGTWTKPLTVDPTLKTGHYSPVREFVDLTDGDSYETLEDFINENEIVKTKGLRFLTKEKVNSFGYLYSLKGAKEVVETVGNGWRIPTLQDWNNMMNYIESTSGCTCDNPHSGRSITELGCIAGKALKSTKLWIDDEDAFGTDDYGFSVLPVGSMLCNQEVDAPMPDFGRNAYFWTGTDFEDNGAWIKSFSFTNTTVRQEPDTGVRMYSLRLVKDGQWDGIDNEIIGGEIVPCASMPYIDEQGDRHSLIWTMINVAVPISHDKEYRYPTLWDEYADEAGYKNVQPGYFICEWNGQEWKKRQMIDGDSVVVLDSDSIDGTDDDEKEYAEYRVEWNEELEEFVLVDVLDSFREEVREMLSEVFERIEALETSAHTHENKEILDSITQERVEKWDSAEDNAKAFASAYTDSKLSEVYEAVSAMQETVAEVVTELDAVEEVIGLDENLEPDFRGYKYVQIEDTDIPTGTIPEGVDEIDEKPTSDDPEYVVLTSVVPVQYYHKVETTKFIPDSENIVDALKKLDDAIQEEGQGILESAMTYTDKLEDKVDKEIADREREERKLYVKPQDKSMTVLHCTDGTYVSVNLPEINSADTTPNHLWYDNDGMYFDGFFGMLPEYVITNQSLTLIEYLGLTKTDITRNQDEWIDEVQDYTEEGYYKAVRYTANMVLKEGATIRTPLEIEVVENVQAFRPEDDHKGDNHIFTVEFNPGETAASVDFIIVSHFNDDEICRDITELTVEYHPNTLHFTENGTDTMIVEESGNDHMYKLQKSGENLDEIVRFGVKQNKDVRKYGFTVEDYENADWQVIDEDNDMLVQFTMAPVEYPGFDELDADEQERVRKVEAYDLFVMTAREIRWIGNHNSNSNDISQWSKEDYLVNGKNVYRLVNSSNLTIFDPEDGQEGETKTLVYDIIFKD